MSTPEDESVSASPAVEAFVGSKHGVTEIEIVGDEVVEYALVHDCTTRDLATMADGSVAVAASADVFVEVVDDGRAEKTDTERSEDDDAELIAASEESEADDGNGDGDAETAEREQEDEADDEDEKAFVGTGFGPAVAVGGDPLLAASPRGDISRLVDGEWDPVGTLSADVNAIDGDLVATDDGVFRVTEGGIQHVGLERAADVSTAGIPHAATERGLFKLGAGWMAVAEGTFTLVEADDATADAGVLRRAHAATPDQLFVFDGESWGPWHIPVDAPVTGFGYDEAVFAVSEDGTLITAYEGEWQTRHLGLSGVTGIVVRSGGSRE